ncbi:hypothetical protein A6C57_00440 [Fibrella sp. ES10-3-2-2]|nr:hypothetical protein A6C57_00440 [Fibrella sp. ES10-3-2-2]
MTRKNLDLLLTTHRAQRDRAKAMLDQYYYQLEEQNQEEKWLNLYIQHKQIVELLEQETPED